MSLKIPFSNNFSNFSEDVTLEGIPYKFEFKYNVRSEQWTMSILDIDLISLIDGIKLVMNFNLLEQYPGRNLPGGEFYVIDTTGEEVAIDRDNIGPILSLMYITEDELASV